MLRRGNAHISRMVRQLRKLTKFKALAASSVCASLTCQSSTSRASPAPDVPLSVTKAFFAGSLIVDFLLFPQFMLPPCQHGTQVFEVGSSQFLGQTFSSTFTALRVRFPGTLDDHTCLPMRVHWEVRAQDFVADSFHPRYPSRCHSSCDTRCLNPFRRRNLVLAAELLSSEL